MQDAAPDLTGDKQANAGQFRPGQSGNPTGRPKGARSRLTDGFLEVLAADFAEHGAAIIRQCREDKPEVYLAIVAKLVPRHDSLDVGLHKSHEESLQELVRDGAMTFTRRIAALAGRAPTDGGTQRTE